jgi:putative aminopeptidase FrvX
MNEVLLTLLNRLLVTHAPTGLEGEMDALITEELARLRLTPETDRHGNVFVRIAGREAGPLTLITAHKDEVSVIVRKIDDDGKIWVERLGGCYPAKYGEGPFDIMTRTGVVEGVLCVGSTHCSDLSARIQKTKTMALTWDMVYVDCRLDGEQLRQRGVRIGDRGVIGRRRKEPMMLGDDTICGYALDDKGAVAILLVLAAQLCETPPEHDICLGFTASEEGGCSGGAYLCQAVGAEDFIAVEVAPVADEYPVRLSAEPVILFKDALFHYTPSLSHALMDAAAAAGITCQSQVVRTFGSEASSSLKAGLISRGACIGYPTQNTHGYEMSSLSSLAACVTTLAKHVTG